MKILRQKEKQSGYLFPDDFNYELKRVNLFDYSFFLNTENNTFEPIACLCCPEKFCMNFKITEFPESYQSFVPTVCPTNAITVLFQLEIDYRLCIGCGLCIIRCPYGAIKINKKGLPEINTLNEKYIRLDLDEFVSNISKVRFTFDINDRNKEKFISLVLSNIRDGKQNTIYPLICNLLTSMRLPTKITRSGDTNDRTDAVIVLDENSIPVEIKSPTETLTIDVKSIRQAIENKIIMLSRNTHNTKYHVTSLVIGFIYPSDRSDVSELIGNINDVWGINIGLFSFETLYELLLKAYYDRIKLDLNKIITLRGKLR